VFFLQRIFLVKKGMSVVGFLFLFLKSHKKKQPKNLTRFFQRELPSAATDGPRQ